MLVIKQILVCEQVAKSDVAIGRIIIIIFFPTRLMTMLATEAGEVQPYEEHTRLPKCIRNA